MKIYQIVQNMQVLGSAFWDSWVHKKVINYHTTKEKADNMCKALASTKVDSYQDIEFNTIRLCTGDEDNKEWNIYPEFEVIEITVQE